MSRVVTAEIVEKSITTLPAAIVLATPWSPNSTDSTSAVPVTLVQTNPAPARGLRRADAA